MTVTSNLWSPSFVAGGVGGQVAADSNVSLPTDKCLCTSISNRPVRWWLTRRKEEWKNHEDFMKIRSSR